MIITAKVFLASAGFYGQSRNYTREIPKMEKESSADYEERTWRNRLHSTPDGNVFIPPTAFKNCLSECAKYISMQIPGKGKATYTKHIEAGVMVDPQPIVLPIKAAAVDGAWLFLPASGKRGDGKRVWKCMPFIKEWSAEVTFMVVDETVTESVFRYHMEQAGKFIGIGYFRPRNNGYWGRFSVTGLEWKKA